MVRAAWITNNAGREIKQSRDFHHRVENVLIVFLLFPASLKRRVGKLFCNVFHFLWEMSGLEFSVYLFPHSLSAHLFITLTLYYTMYTHKARACGRRASKSDESADDVFSVHAMKENDVKSEWGNVAKQPRIEKTFFTVRRWSPFNLLRQACLFWNFRLLVIASSLIVHASQVRGNAFSCDIIKLETRSNIIWCKTPSQDSEKKSNYWNNPKRLESLTNFWLMAASFFSSTSERGRGEKRFSLKYVKPEWRASHDWEKLMSTNWKKNKSIFIVPLCQILLFNETHTWDDDAHDIHIGGWGGWLELWVLSKNF